MNDNKLLLFSGVLVGLFMLSLFYIGLHHDFERKSLDEKAEEFKAQKDVLIAELVSAEKYKCCLTKPCVSCLDHAANDDHDDELVCDCLEDVVLGEAPCHECLGGILEGHGNPYLSKYFARSLSDEMGSQNIEFLKDLIEEKYGTSIEDQY